MIQYAPCADVSSGEKFCKELHRHHSDLQGVSFEEMKNSEVLVFTGADF